MSIEKLTADLTQARYLTKPELRRLADYFENDRMMELADLLLGDHAPANGACYEVLLTDEEAQQVDDACQMLGMGY